MLSYFCGMLECFLGGNGKLLHILKSDLKNFSETFDNTVRKSSICDELKVTTMINETIRILLIHLYFSDVKVPLNLH